MAKVIHTTDEKVLKAAKDFPKAEGMLRDLFPDAFPPVFKGGDIVDFVSGHPMGPFVVVHPSIASVIKNHYDLNNSSLVHIISLKDGQSYSPYASSIQLVDRKGL